MTEQISPEAQLAPEPELKKHIVDPKGVLQKNMKLVLYLSAALLVIVAAVFSSSGKKTLGAQAATKNQSPQPTVQDNTDYNVAELKSQLQAEQLKEQQEASSNALPQGGTPAQQAAAAGYGPTGQPVAVYFWPALLPGIRPAGQRSVTAHTGAATGATTRGERTRTGVQLALRVEPCVCKVCRCAPRAVATRWQHNTAWQCTESLLRRNLAAV